MIVVSNASPLVGLAAIDQFDLLRVLYGNILIPEAVWHEVVVEGQGRPGSNEVSQAEWIAKRSVRNQPLVLALRQDLDVGEAEAISLTIELNADLLIMDERLGRNTARHFGLNFIGIVGVLVEAKHKGALPRIKPCLDRLRDAAGFHISDELFERVLTDEGEVV